MMNYLVMAIGLYLIHVIVSFMARRDGAVAEYKIVMEQDRSVLRESVMREKYREALDGMAISYDDMDFDGRAFEEYLDMLEDDVLLDEAVDEYIKKLKKAMRFRSLTLLLTIFMADVYTLIPTYILFLSGDVYLSIMVSVFLMLISSLADDYMLRRVTSDTYGEEVAEDVMSYFPTKLRIVFNSVIRQAHFYLLLWILL